MAIDPVKQSERFLLDYVHQFADLGAWAQHPPRHSLCFEVIYILFSANLDIDDLESILQGMLAERIKPKSWSYLRKILLDRIKDLQHERSTTRLTDAS